MIVVIDSSFSKYFLSTLTSAEELVTTSESDFGGIILNMGSACMGNYM